MKLFKLFLAMLFAIVILNSAGFSQKQIYPSKLKDDQTQLIDTRIDNMGYWKKLAAEGLVPVAQPVPVLPSKYTGSMINAKSVKGGKEDSPDVPVTELTNVTESENSIFVDPTDNEHILNSNNSTSWSGSSVGSLYGANYFLSGDAGLTWGGSHLGAGGSNSGDPTTAINLDGTRMYVGYISSSGGQGVSYSTDDGETWTPKIAGTAGGGFFDLLDKNHMWIDNSPTSPYEGNLYNGWTAFGGANNNQIEIVRSDDGGLTWSAQMSVSNAVNAGSHNQGVNIQTGPNGEVYACWSIYDNFPTDETAIGFTRSYDGGETFEPATRIISNIRGIRNSGVGKQMRVNAFPVMAVDISGGSYNGNIYIVWTNIGEPGINTGSDADVYMIRSEDDGDTWSDPVRVNQDPAGQGKKHYFPWITCDPETGILSAIFYDDREVGPAQVEVYCANSFDAGETWEDFKVSDVAFTPSPIPGLADNYMGDYLGISARGSMVYPVWTDNRDGLHMTYTSPFVTNNLPKPSNLIIVLDEETGETNLGWQYDGEDFLYFNVYRDGNVIGTTTEQIYTDNLPDYGVFSYSVTAVHDDGESVAASSSVQWGNAAIAINPLEMEVILAPGELTTEVMTIENIGELELSYEIETEILSKKGSKDYCSASGGCDEYIAQVIFGDIDNSSSCDGYGDYTDQSTAVNVDETYDLTVVNGNVYSSDDLGVWVDWNQDGDFEDAGENVVCEADNGGEGTFPVTVPSDALAGETTMRIRLKWSGSDCGNPCGTTTYGEVEDYTLVVQGWLFVEPNAGDVSAGDTDPVNITLDASDLTDGTYTANLHVSSNDPENELLTIPVTLLVGEDILQVFATADPAEICEGESSQLTALPEGGTGNYNYLWEPSTGLSDPTIAAPVASPVESTTYTVTVDDGEMTSEAEVTISVNPLPESPAIPVGETAMCQDNPNSTYTTEGTLTALSYNWYISPPEAGEISGNGDLGIVDWNAEYSGPVEISVVGVNDCGEGDASEVLEVMINALPDVSLNVSDTVCIYNPEFELTGGEPQGGVYSGNGVTETGGIYYFNPEAAGLGEHTISYFYSDENGCENLAEASISVDECLSVNENYAGNLEVLPNPNTGKFNLNFDLDHVGKVTLRIFNNNGVEVLNREITVAGEYQSTEIDLSEYAQGLYYISVTTDNASTTEKMIIRK